MSKRNGNKPLLPFYVIKATADGDTDAIATVLEHFDGYIAALSTKRLYDEYGNSYMCVDESLRAELNSKLVQGIHRFKVA
ncbi:helix-turn-helix domain-containing protein [Lachnospiraceae bacterium ZAX-1]